MHYKGLLIPMLLITVSCSTATFPGIYQVPIEQGNSVEQQTVEQLALGMTEEQVVYLLGQPLVSNLFDANRLDYVYTLSRGGRQQEEYRLMLYFEDGVLVGIDNDGLDVTTRS